jgi:hypothetical protein
VSHERQKPVNDKYRDNYDGIFHKRHVPHGTTIHWVDEIVGTTPYLNGQIVAKQEGHTYRVRPKVRKGGNSKSSSMHRDRKKYRRPDAAAYKAFKEGDL